MNLFFKRNCLVLKVIYILTLLYACLDIHKAMDVVMIIVSCVLPFAIPSIFKICGKKMSDEMIALNLIFIYFASLIGSCLGGYRLLYFDKVIHFASGILAFTFGLLVYRCWVKDKMSDSFRHVFCHLFNLSIAVCWEFYEYFMLVVFNHDCIKHYATGVHDALTDMLCAFCGGIFVSLCLLNARKKGKQSLFERLVSQFDENN